MENKNRSMNAYNKIHVIRRFTVQIKNVENTPVRCDKSLASSKSKMSIEWSEINITEINCKDLSFMAKLAYYEPNRLTTVMSDLSESQSLTFILDK